MTTTKTLSLLPTFITLAALSVSCAVTATPEPTVMPQPTVIPTTPLTPQVLRLYSSFPLVGGSASDTSSMVHAIQLAIEQKTQAGTLCAGQYVVEYVSLDDADAGGQWAANLEQANAEQAAADSSAVAYIGPYNSAAARISIPILNAAGLVMISPANTADDLTASPTADEYYLDGQRNYGRVIARDEFQGAFAADWAAQLSARRIYVLADTAEYGRGIANQFQQRATALGLELVGQSGVDGASLDVPAVTAQILAAEPDLIFYGGIAYEPVFQLVSRLRAEGLTATFMGPDGILIPAFAHELAADAGDGIYSLIAGAPSAKLPAAGQQFLADYAARYEAPSRYAIYAYEAANVILVAIAKTCSSERVAILETVLQTKDFSGVLGTWSFDAQGDTTLYSMLGFQVVNGEWAEVTADLLPILP